LVVVSCDTNEPKSTIIDTTSLESVGESGEMMKMDGTLGMKTGCIVPWKVVVVVMKWWSFEKNK
jgi:hypothetical protein